MNVRIFYTVDVFAEYKVTGNQLAVCLNADNLTGAQMQGIAKEMHFSETTFIVSDSQFNGGYDVRIYPKGGSAFCRASSNLGYGVCHPERCCRSQ